MNVIGIWLCCRAIGQVMLRQHDGSIVNIASGVPFKSVPHFLHYVASKGAVVALTRTLAKEIGEHGVRVNAGAPGFTLSEASLANEEQMRMLGQLSVESRVIQREEGREDVVGPFFLRGGQSVFMTGRTIVVDGGRGMTSER